MQKTTIYLDDETKFTLKRIAELEGKTQAQTLREAVAAYAVTLRKPRAKGIGAYRSGRKDVSEKAEELLKAAAKSGKWR
jgi:predicted transcriptional regulator